MSAPITHHLTLPDPDTTARLAQGLATMLIPGDTVLLTGAIGAGKTHFARALIKARLAHDGAFDEDVPSPTFTLVQTYDTGAAELWHADLYRLTHPDEVEELGLIDAFETAICLVEWPDRLGELTPANALSITLTQGEADDARQMALTITDPDMAARLAPVLNEFLND